ncbi:MAG: ATP synthase gamma chain [Legionellaceae bacterium]
MAGAKEIRTKIGSIKNTQKITRAMEMVAASKMRRAQERMQTSRPYANKIREVINHLAKAKSEYRHAFLSVRPIKRIGYIVISSDRGLCGGLNINLFKTTIADMRKHHEEGIDIDLCLIGKKAEAFFKRYGGKVVAQANHLGDSPSVMDIVGVVKMMLDSYEEGNIDALYIVYNEFVNTMTQSPQIEQLLPITTTTSDEENIHHWDYIYEPDARELLNVLLARYIESLVYQTVVENLASEQAARMISMKNASDNAGEIINELQLAYNKARQAAITQELSEIIGGASAV